MADITLPLARRAVVCRGFVGATTPGQLSDVERASALPGASELQSALGRARLDVVLSGQAALR